MCVVCVRVPPDCDSNHPARLSQTTKIQNELALGLFFFVCDEG